VCSLIPAITFDRGLEPLDIKANPQIRLNWWWKKKKSIKKRNRIKTYRLILDFLGWNCYQRQFISGGILLIYWYTSYIL
jgi:hypothetical protein